MRSFSANAALCVLCFASHASATTPVSNVRSIDGSGNNLHYSHWGAAETQLQRVAESPSGSGAYYPGDGSGAIFYGGPGDVSGVVNPREISNTIYDDFGHYYHNERQMSHMVWQWGQFLDHDITLTETNVSTTEYAPIEVSEGDAMWPAMEFQRSNFVAGTGTSYSNPRQQINSITSYIDASNVYGSDAVRAAAIRDTGNGGRLKTSAGDLLPFNTAGLPNAGGPDSGLFLGGDVRANEQVGLASMHTLFVREHNRLADLLAANNPTWTDEELYQTSRKIVGAEMQAITYQEFLPALLGRRYTRDLLPRNYSYDETINATISNEFATAIYRFGHSMLPEELPLASVGGLPAGGIPLAEAFFDPSHLTSDATGATNNLEQLLLGLSQGVAQEIDAKVTDAIRNFLFGPPGAGGLDLASLNIHRGRDHGLPSYNEMRIAYGLSPVSSFKQVTRDRSLARELRDMYGSVDNADAWVGMLAEEHMRGSSMGELGLTAIVAEFLKLRDGDRFFYTGDEELMNNPVIDAVIDLDSITLADIITFNTSLDNVPRNVFRGRVLDINLVLDGMSDQMAGIKGFFDSMADHMRLADVMPSVGKLNIVSIPEPSTWLLSAMFGSVGLLRRRPRVR